MTKYLALVLLLMTSCVAPGTPLPGASTQPSPVASPSVAPSPSPAPAPSPSVVPSPSPTGGAGSLPSMSFTTITAYDSEIPFVKAGLDNVNKVLASDCFRQAVLASNFTENKGLTAGQIYQLLATHPIAINVVMYTGSFMENHVWHTIGKEYEPGTVYMNRYFVQSAYMVGDNAIHEGEGHSQGFTHLGTKSTSEPYGMNQIYEKCAPLLGISQ